MVGGNDLGHGGHPYRVCAESSERTDFGGRFITRPRTGKVNTFTNIHLCFCGTLLCQGAQFRVVCIAHIGETASKRVFVLPDERISAHKVDMVFNQHNIADRKRRIDAASRIGENQNFHTEPPHGANRQKNIRHIVPLVKMEPPLHTNHLLARKRACHEPPFVSGRGGNGEPL